MDVLPKSIKSAEVPREPVRLSINSTLQPPSNPQEVDDDDLVIMKNLSKPRLASPELSDFLEQNSDSDTCTISDDDDEDGLDKLKKIDPTEIICHRCPHEKQGVWKDHKKFLTHIKRHVVAGQFGCSVCKKPFTKLGECLKHERNFHRDGNVMADDNAYNFGKTARKSKAIYAYRGPLVSSIWESYAIQLSGNLSKKAGKANGIAKLAVKKHRKIAKLNRVDFKCKFFKKLQLK